MVETPFCRLINFLYYLKFKIEMKLYEVFKNEK